MSSESSASTGWDAEYRRGGVASSVRDAELGDAFRLDMAWRKERRGPMHGAEYVRRTTVTPWSASDAR